MNITKPTNETPACYGIGCERHATCQRYAMVEDTCWSETIGTCDHHGDGARPLFLVMRREEVEV